MKEKFKLEAVSKKFNHHLKRCNYFEMTVIGKIIAAIKKGKG